MRCVAVIGAGGFIGYHILGAFERAGMATRAIDVRIPQHIHQPASDWLVGDIGEDTFCARAVAGCDCVVFVAGYSLPATGNNDVAAEVHHHVERTLKTAEISLMQGVERFIFASSGGTVYGIDSIRPISEDAPTRPRNAYGVSKLAIEHYLRIITQLRGLKCISLRISNPYGEYQYATSGQGFVAAAMDRAVGGKPLAIWGDGTTVRDFIYVGDVAEAFVAATCHESDRTEINIGSGLGHSLKDIVYLVQEATDREISVSFETSRKVDVASNILDISVAESELKWRPKMSIKEGLVRTADWWLGAR